MSFVAGTCGGFIAAGLVQFCHRRMWIYALVNVCTGITFAIAMTKMKRNLHFPIYVGGSVVALVLLVLPLTKWPDYGKGAKFVNVCATVLLYVAMTGSAIGAWSAWMGHMDCEDQDQDESTTNEFRPPDKSDSTEVGTSVRILP